MNEWMSKWINEVRWMNENNELQMNEWNEYK